MAEPVVRVHTPAYLAYQVLHIVFTILPIAAGIDKVFHFLVNWDLYLSPLVTRVTALPAHTFMLAVGGIEVVAGVLVAAVPRIGAWIVGLWLCGIVLNLLSIPGYFDIAVRDAALAFCAFSLALLAEEFHGHRV